MKKNATPTSVADDDILTPEEAGNLFGVSKWAMYKRVKNGTIIAHYMGRRMYFLKSELITLVSEL